MTKRERIQSFIDVDSDRNNKILQLFDIHGVVSVLLYVNRTK